MSAAESTLADFINGGGVVSGPSPSNRLLLERGITIPHQQEEEQQRQQQQQHQDLMSDGLTLDERDLDSIKTIVEQTFTDGRDMMDIISAV